MNKNLKSTYTGKGRIHKKTYNDKGEKWCSNCHVHHALNLFGRRRSSYDGRSTTCLDSLRKPFRLTALYSKEFEQKYINHKMMFELLQSTQSCPPPTRDKFLKTHLMNPWSYDVSVERSFK